MAAGQFGTEKQGVDLTKPERVAIDCATIGRVSMYCATIGRLGCLLATIGISFNTETGKRFHNIKIDCIPISASGRVLKQRLLWTVGTARVYNATVLCCQISLEL